MLNGMIIVRRHIQTTILTKTWLHANTIKLTFDEESFMARPTINQPFVSSVHELRLGIVGWLKENWSDLLECIVTKTTKDSGHSILWAPPYTPDLQVDLGYW
jgi:hypothetical protein